MAEKASRFNLSLRKKLLFSTAVLLATLAILEIGLRLTGPVYRPSLNELPYKDPPGIDPIAYFGIADRYLGYRNRPNGSFSNWCMEGTPLCTTDENGFRNGHGWPGKEGMPIVLFVGDSTTFCAEVSDTQTAPSEVAKLLEKEADVRVLNAGVRAYSTLQAKRMMLRCFERFSDVRAVVYTYCTNDVEENLVPNLVFPLPTPTLRFDEPSNKFIEVEPVETLIEWGDGFILDTPRRLSKTQWLNHHCAVFNRCLAGWRRLRSTRLGDNVSYEFPTGQTTPDDHANWRDWALRNRGHDALAQMISEMDEACRERGATFLVVPWSDGADPHSSEWLFSLCGALGVASVNLESEMTETPETYRAVRIDGLHDSHYGASGTKAYARAVAPALLNSLNASSTEPATSVAVDQNEPAI